MTMRHPRGLVTVSLLKSYFDERHDHLEMFMPLLLDAIRAHGADDFSSQQMAVHVQAHTGLLLPAGTIDVLLSRARTRGCIEREGGRFFINREAVSGFDLTAARSDVQLREERLAQALTQFAAERDGDNALGTEEALAAIVRFIDQNQLLLLINSDDSSTSDVGDDSTRHTRLVARFVLERCLPSSDLAEDLRTLVDGFVLQNALLLRDLGTLTKDFQSLTVFLDTTFLFGLRGIRGSAEEQSAREAVQLLQALNAKLAIFDNTLNEMRRILLVYESRLGTSAGKSTLRPREETRFFLKNRYTPALVREMLVGLESWFKSLGIEAIGMPYHDPRFTLDEQSLGEKLKGPDDPEAPRVRNDVDCIAAVLTLRAGRHPRSMDSARAVIATTAGKLVVNSTSWYRDQSQPGIPPVVHLAALTSIAWLKKPAAAIDIKLHELIALCAAALRPTPATWDRFLYYLKKARTDGTLTSDEEVAILASELTDSHLSELSDTSEDADAATLAEVVARVKEAYGDRTAEVEAAATEQRRQLELRQGVELERAAKMTSEMQTAHVAAETRARFLEGELEARALTLRRKARRWASALAWIVYIGAAVAFLTGSWAAGSLPSSTSMQWLVRIGGALAATLGLAGALWGTHLGELRCRLAGWLEERFVTYLTS